MSTGRGHIDYSDTWIERAEKHNEWLTIGMDVGQYAMPLARRSDMVAAVGPGIAEGAPACFIPSKAELRIDSAMVLPPDTKPGTVDLKDALWQLEHAEFMGTVAHEAGHAAHTRWLAPNLVREGASDRQIDLAIVLEEPRIEYRMVQRKAKTRTFLRASAVGLILKDFAIGDSAYGASVSAGLLLARADGGILEQDDVTTIHAQIEGILGPSKLQLLRPLWQAFLDLADRDVEGVLDLTSRWLQILGPEVEGQPLAAPGLAMPVAGPGGEGGEVPDWMGKAAGQIAIAADTAVSRKRMGERIRRDREAASADGERHKSGAHARSIAFPPPDGMESQGTNQSSRTPYRRQPTQEERSATTELAASLIRIRSSDGELVRSDRPNPPGRLNTRSLVRSIASESDDPPPDLFRHNTRAPGPDEHLTIGLMVDISGSMSSAAAPMASAQWVVSRAGSAVGAQVAVVHYGIEAYGVQRLGGMPETVDVYECRDGWENFTRAFLAMDAEAQLLDRPGARLLVIASDGRYGRPEQAKYAEQAMTLCKQKGVQVLWMDFTGSHRTSYGHGTIVHVRGLDPQLVVRKISDAILAMQNN